MAPSVVDVLLKITARTEELTRATQEAQRNAAALRQSTQRATEFHASLRQAAVAGAAFAGVSLSVAGLAAGLYRLVTGAATAADNFQNLARRIGGTFEGVQVLDRLAREFGQTADVFTGGVDRLNQRLAEARAGSEEAARPFHALRLTLAEFENLTAERKLELVARAIANADDRNAAFLAGVEILGVKAAPQLQAALERLGTEGFDRLADRMRNAGQIIDDAMGARLADAKKNLEDLTNYATIAGGKIAGAFIGTADAAAGLAVALTSAPGRGSNRGATSRVEEIRSQTNAIGSDEDRTRLLDQFRREADELRATMQAIDLQELDRRTPQAPQDRAQAEGLRQVLAELDDAQRVLADPILSQVLQNLNEQEREAVKIADAAKLRAIAEERASIWLAANGEKMRAANAAQAEALLPDERRLEILRERLVLLDAESAAAKAAAGSAAELERVTLESDAKRLPILREQQRLTESVTRAQQSAASDARRAAAEALELEVRRREILIDQVQFERQLLNDRHDISEVEKRQRIVDLVARERDLIAQIIALKRSAPAQTEAERVRTDAEVQELEQRSATAGRGSEPAVQKTIGLAGRVEQSVAGISTAIGDAAAGFSDFGDAASTALRRVLADIAAAAAQALIFRAILGLPGVGSFLGNLGVGAGYAAGGFTGAGGRNQVAGVVHRGEYVVPADAVSRTGPGAWASMVHSVRGFADGGFAGPAAALRFRDPSARTFSAGALADSGAGGRGAGHEATNVFQYTFEAGVTPQQLSNLLPQLERASVRAARDAMRRNEL